MMASTHSHEAESEAFSQALEIGESHIGELALSQPAEQPAAVHRCGQLRRYGRRYADAWRHAILI